MRKHDYWVYILTNKRYSTLYVGVTNNIVRRLHQHRFGEVKGF
jgi:predicted GIY-YIG superfamily endonuclease